MDRKIPLKVAGVQLALATLFSISACAGLAVDDAAAEAISRGSSLLGEEQYQEAIGLFDKAIESNPESVKAHELRARTYAEMGDYPKALVDYTKLISLAPDNAAYYSERSMIYLQLQDFPKAIDDLGKLIATGRDDMAYYTRGWAYGQVGEHEKAIADYTQFIAKTKDEVSKADGYYNRGNEYFELNQSQKALDDISKASKIDAQQKLASGGTRAIGVDGERKDISIVPDYAKAYYRCGMVYNTLGKPNDAIDNFSRAIALNPELPDYYKARAAAYEKIGQHDKAAADANKASRAGGKAGDKKVADGAKQSLRTNPANPGKPAPPADANKNVDVEKFNKYLSELEKKNLGRTYADDLIPERLGRIEMKLFSKVKTGSYKHRLDELMLKGGQ